MNGKSPIPVITNGDQSMRNAIRNVFPNAHHRLCAWHLMRNATSHIGNPEFTKKFRECMLSDFEVGVFRRKWTEMVEEFGVQDRPWIVDLYERRHMWATTHLRGKFFAGFRTTSWCEGLHSLLVKYLKSHYNLSDFLGHFWRCLAHLRHKEMMSDFAYAYAEAIMQTHLQHLERFASNIYTREIFYLFRQILKKASTMKVILGREIASSVIYIVSKYCRPKTCWHVSYFADRTDFRCSYFRRESLGIPCGHITAVLVFLDICELPRSLVLSRWTKNTKEGLEDISDRSGVKWDVVTMSRYGCMMDWCRQLSALVCLKSSQFHEARDIIMSLITRFKLENEAETEAEAGQVVDNPVEAVTKDPQIVRTKGYCSQTAKRKTQRCSVCRVEGHK